jgi:hypothetical protein
VPASLHCFPTANQSEIDHHAYEKKIRDMGLGWISNS